MGRASRIGVAVLMVAVFCVGLPAQPAAADPNRDLCAYDPARGEVPAQFTLDACVDGTDIVIVNDLGFPVELVTVRNPDGHTTSPLQWDTKSMTTYAQATRIQHEDAYPGTNLVLPGDKVRYEVGDAGASITVVAVPNFTYFTYVSLESLSSLNVPLNVINELRVLYEAIQQNEQEYAQCLARRDGVLAAAKCFGKAYAGALKAYAKFLVGVIPGTKATWKTIQRVLSLETYGKLLGGPQDALDLTLSEKVLTQAPLGELEPGCYGGGPWDLDYVGPMNERNNTRVWYSSTGTPDVIITRNGTCAGGKFYNETLVVPLAPVPAPTPELDTTGWSDADWACYQADAPWHYATSGMHAESLRTLGYVLPDTAPDVHLCR